MQTTDATSPLCGRSCSEAWRPHCTSPEPPEARLHKCRPPALSPQTMHVAALPTPGNSAATEVRGAVAAAASGSRTKTCPSAGAPSSAPLLTDVDHTCTLRTARASLSRIAASSASACTRRRLSSSFCGTRRKTFGSSARTWRKVAARQLLPDVPICIAARALGVVPIGTRRVCKHSPSSVQSLTQALAPVANAKLCSADLARGARQVTPPSGAGKPAICKT
mmetsp:Transcript_23680/g.49254  ORF Transcript_23680/g.49254 Transcript_23680/m.49254 type:complete len:222 (+) Transcript_23680:377-1042(+)